MGNEVTCRVPEQQCPEAVAAFVVEVQQQHSSSHPGQTIIVWKQRTNTPQVEATNKLAE